MNRISALLIGPEAVLALLTAGVFAFCSRHNSYGDQDVSALERLIWLLPLVVVVLGFGTIGFSPAKTWTWLVRANVATMICLAACAIRVVSGFGAPGSGPKGQDAGFFLALALGIGCGALANAICAAMILRAQRPAIADWFREHVVLGPVLTALATVPFFALQTILAGVLTTIASIVLTFAKS